MIIEHSAQQRVQAAARLRSTLTDLLLMELTDLLVMEYTWFHYMK